MGILKPVSPAWTTARQRPSREMSAPRWSCPDCGGPVTNHRNVGRVTPAALPTPAELRAARETGPGDRIQEEGTPRKEGRRSRVRSGKYTPHASIWPELDELVGDEGDRIDTHLMSQATGVCEAMLCVVRSLRSDQIAELDAGRKSPGQ